MKSLLFTLTLGVFLACSSSSEAPQDVTAAAPAPVTTPAPANITPPCEALAADFVASTLGWKSSFDGAPTTMRDGRLQSCLFTAEDNSGGLTAVSSQSDARTIERKGLERSYTTDLEDTEGRMTKEAVADLGDQAIYAYGKRGPNHMYKLRWRSGNEIEYWVEYRSTKQRDAAAVLSQLKALAAKL